MASVKKTTRASKAKAKQGGTAKAKAPKPSSELRAKRAARTSVATKSSPAKSRRKGDARTAASSSSRASTRAAAKPAARKRAAQGHPTHQTSPSAAKKAAAGPRRTKPELSRRASPDRNAAGTSDKVSKRAAAGSPTPEKQETKAAAPKRKLPPVQSTRRAAKPEAAARKATEAPAKPAQEPAGVQAAVGPVVVTGQTKAGDPPTRAQAIVVPPLAASGASANVDPRPKEQEAVIKKVETQTGTGVSGAAQAEDVSRAEARTVAAGLGSKMAKVPASSQAIEPGTADGPSSATAAAKAPSAASRPKGSGAQRQTFKPGEFVVYPAHGVGQIIAIEEQEVAGFKLELYVISFVKDKMILKVPVAKSLSVGMRKLADAGAVKAALTTLAGRARIKRTMWSRRAQEYEAKINSGDLNAIAEVVRDLHRSESQPEQSYSERQLYEAALDRMAREIVVVQNVTETESLKIIETHLQKGPRRGKAEESQGEEAETEDTGIEEAA